MQTRIRTIPIFTGELGTVQTLQMMRTLVLESLNSPRLCKVASALWMSTLSTKADIRDAVDDFLRQRFIYSNEVIETLQTPDYMLMGYETNRQFVGDCDDISMVQAALLVCLGFEVRFVAIRSNPDDPNYDHVFVEAKPRDATEWNAFDVTVPLGTHIEYYSKVAIPV